jgi:hypothetical protein
VKRTSRQANPPLGIMFTSRRDAAVEHLVEARDELDMLEEHQDENAGTCDRDHAGSALRAVEAALDVLDPR